MKVFKTWKSGRSCVIYPGDCADLLSSLPDNSVDLVLTSPPYCMGKDYETSTNPNDFSDMHRKLLGEIIRITKQGGSICWQVGYHVSGNVITPLDFLVYEIMRGYTDVKLRNRIMWTFGHGLHSARRFSGRHETLLWFSKGDDYTFNLDAIRVLQKYPGKRHYKGMKRGEFSGNPLGKNPTDVWEIPNVKANHIEKTKHPCQFPIALATRVVRAFSNPGDVILDPFTGSGSTAAAALLEKRSFVGAELKNKYYKIAVARAEKALSGELRYRPDGVPVYSPAPNTPLTTVPKLWQRNHQNPI